MKFFNNVTMPNHMVFNVQGAAGSRADGGAEIEHHYDKEGKKGLWLQQTPIDPEWLRQAVQASKR